MNGAGNEFLTRPGLAGDQDTGIGRSNFRYPGKDRLQRWRSSHDLFEHRGFVDLFAQCNVLVLKSLLGLLAIVDIRRGGIPTLDLALFISERVPAEEEPAILPVLPHKARFVFVRLSAQELTLGINSQAFPIIWVIILATVGISPFVKGKTKKIEHCLISIKTSAIAVMP